MKKQFLLTSILFLLILSSCKKDENTYVTNQETYNIKEDFDIKASKMEQIGGLFESIARQPEAAKILISSAELVYKDYTELLPISDTAIEQRGKARGVAFSALLASIARQPEVFNELDSAAAKFLGKYDTSYISNELLDISRTYTVKALNESIARQPEADSLFNIICKKYLNFELKLPK